MEKVLVQCEICWIFLNSEEELKEHYRTAANHHCCTLCPKKFKRQTDLEEHVKDNHKPCPFCRKLCRDHKDLMKHCDKSHSLCKHCDHYLPNADKLEEHILKKHPKATSPCLCGVRFGLLSSLLKHIEAGNCPGCSPHLLFHLFKNRRIGTLLTNTKSGLFIKPASTLDEMITTICDRERETERYCCRACGKLFEYLPMFESHFHDGNMKLAPEAKMWECSGCEGTLRSPSGVVLHAEHRSVASGCGFTG